MESDLELRPIPSLPGWLATSAGGIVEAATGLEKALYRHRYVSVSIPGHGNRAVHRLIAEAWYGQCPVGMVVMHLNNNKHDNRPENLKYGSQAENVRAAVRDGLHHAANRTSCQFGHPYDEHNTYYRKDRSGGRECKSCFLDRQNARRRAGVVPEHAHGTTGGYDNYGCRCDKCRFARMEWQRNYRQRKALEKKGK